MYANIINFKEADLAKNKKSSLSYDNEDNHPYCLLNTIADLNNYPKSINAPTLNKSWLCCKVLIYSILIFDELA